MQREQDRDAPFALHRCLPSCIRLDHQHASTFLRHQPWPTIGHRTPCCWRQNEMLRYENYGSLYHQYTQLRVENHNSHTLAFCFDASKGAYGQWWAMVDVVVRWMRVGCRGGCKMEHDDGGQTGHPRCVPISKHRPFSIVSRN